MMTSRPAVLRPPSRSLASMTAVHTVNARDGMGLTAARSYFEMTAPQFRAFVLAHQTILEPELAKHGVAYAELGPALVPRTARHEMALLFNSDRVSGPFYGRAVAQRLIPLLGKEATQSVMAGDIGLPPLATREMARHSGLVGSALQDWGQQYTYCVYLNNLSIGQTDRLHAAYAEETGYLGYVPTTYRTDFRTVVANMVGTVFIKHKQLVLVDHGMDDPWVGASNELGYPFEPNGLRVVSVNQQLFSPLLTYKIQAEVFPHDREDVEVSLNAISDTPMPLSGFEVLIPEAKFGYLHAKKGGILKLVGLDQHTRQQLAGVIRAELENDYIYRLQHNSDGTVQFSIVLELPREASHPVKVAVGLKYYPDAHSLSLVTLT
jgi:hypothetical protein